MKSPPLLWDRQTAIALNLRQYNPGHPCPHGHTTASAWESNELQNLEVRPLHTRKGEKA